MEAKCNEYFSIFHANVSAATKAVVKWLDQVQRSSIVKDMGRKHEKTSRPEQHRPATEAFSSLTASLAIGDGF